MYFFAAVPARPVDDDHDEREREKRLPSRMNGAEKKRKKQKDGILMLYTSARSSPRGPAAARENVCEFSGNIGWWFLVGCLLRVNIIIQRNNYEGV